MRIEPLKSGDWTRFMDMAENEGWLVPKAERALFQNGWKRHMFTLSAFGQICGFVSAIPHQVGGWIGNLIVASEFRNRGFGTLLFDHAVETLENRGRRDIWLTASPQGRPLYEKKGFRNVDRVNRWVLKGNTGLTGAIPSDADGLELLCRQDRKGWGDCRAELIHALAGQGTVIRQGMSLALLQAGMERRVLGPWVSDRIGTEENRRILESLNGMVAYGGEIVSDVLESAGIDPLLWESGFVQSGGVDLMLRSESRTGQLDGIVSLASLGSLG